MDKRIFENLGFTKSEINVYFSLLELGESSSGNIIKKSKVSRSKVYDVLNRLKDKGLVSETKNSNVSYFRALSPSRILDYLKDKEEKIVSQKEEFKKILPELMNKQKDNSSEQELKVYVGVKGFKTFYRELEENLEDNEEYLGLAFDNLDSNMEIKMRFHRFFKERALRGGKTKLIARNKNQIPGGKNIFNENYEFRWVDSPLPTIAGIFKDSIVIFSWSSVPKIFSITCSQTADDYRKYFYSLWEEAKVK